MSLQERPVASSSSNSKSIALLSFGRYSHCLYIAFLWRLLGLFRILYKTHKKNARTFYQPNICGSKLSCLTLGGYRGVQVDSLCSYLCLFHLTLVVPNPSHSLFSSPTERDSQDSRKNIEVAEMNLWTRTAPSRD